MMKLSWTFESIEMRRTLLMVIVTSVLAASAADAQNRTQPPSSDSRPRPERPSRPDRPPPGRPGDRPGRPNIPPPRPARPPNWGHRPSHHFLSQGRWRPSIRGPLFRYPPGFAYRRWTTGAILPPLFLSGAYFYDNYAPLGLGPPPPGYRWVRYGPDLLLVNTVTGRIADVVDGAFY
jgi:Ni/Co efflux regulator RcnB